MKKIWSDYKHLNKPAKKLGLTPIKEKPGFYKYQAEYAGLFVDTTIDLTASGSDETAILKNMVKQLAEKVNRLAKDHEGEFNYIPDYV